MCGGAWARRSLLWSFWTRSAPGWMGRYRDTHSLVVVNQCLTLLQLVAAFHKSLVKQGMKIMTGTKVWRLMM